MEDNPIIYKRTSFSQSTDIYILEKLKSRLIMQPIVKSQDR